MKTLMDYVFWYHKDVIAYKPAASVVSCRRAGATAALEQMNMYLLFNNMPLVSSCYWSMVHGNKPEEVAQDEEGLQTMRNNMSWLLKCIEVGGQAGIALPEKEPVKRTNFIR